MSRSRFWPTNHLWSLLHTAQSCLNTQLSAWAWAALASSGSHSSCLMSPAAGWVVWPVATADLSLLWVSTIILWSLILTPELRTWSHWLRTPDLMRLSNVKVHSQVHNQTTFFSSSWIMLAWDTTSVMMTVNSDHNTQYTWSGAIWRREEGSFTIYVCTLTKQYLLEKYGQHCLAFTMVRGQYLLKYLNWWNIFFVTNWARLVCCDVAPQLWFMIFWL